jgi:hypothetical protein
MRGPSVFSAIYHGLNASTGDEVAPWWLHEIQLGR